MNAPPRTPPFPFKLSLVLLATWLSGCWMADKNPGAVTMLAQKDGLCFSAQDVPSNAKIWAVSVMNKDGELWRYWEKDPEKQISAKKQCVLFLPEYVDGMARNGSERFAVDVMTVRPNERSTSPYVGYFCATRTPAGDIRLTPITSQSTACQGR